MAPLNRNERKKMTANDILDALDMRHRIFDKFRREWACFRELRFGTGYGPLSDSSIDYYAMNMWPSKNRVKVSYEIKISKTDLKKDLAQPFKQFPALQVSNEFYYIWPKGMLKREEYQCLYNRQVASNKSKVIYIPEWAGVMEVDGTSIKVMKEAQSRPCDSLPWTFVSQIARRACKAETMLNIIRAKENSNDSKRTN